MAPVLILFVAGVLLVLFGLIRLLSYMTVSNLVYRSAFNPYCLSLFYWRGLTITGLFILDIQALKHSLTNQEQFSSHTHLQQ